MRCKKPNTVVSKHDIMQYVHNLHALILDTRSSVLHIYMHTKVLFIVTALTALKCYQLALIFILMFNAQQVQVILLRPLWFLIGATVKIYVALMLFFSPKNSLERCMTILCALCSLARSPTKGLGRVKCR